MQKQTLLFVDWFFILSSQANSGMKSMSLSSVLRAAFLQDLWDNFARSGKTLD